MKCCFLISIFCAAFVTIGCKNSAEPDTIPPNISIAIPQNGAVVSGLSLVRADAIDDEGISRVEFLFDGNLIAGSEDTAEPYEYLLNTTPFATGSQHTVSAKAHDTSDNTKVSEAITVTINNDTGPPSVSIVSPVAQSVISEIVLIRAVAADDQGIADVTFQIDGIELENSSDSTEPYEFLLNTSSYKNGTIHTLTAIASDIVNNVTISSTVDVTIDNSQAMPTRLELLPIEYDSAFFVIKWPTSPDGDFDSYKLHESFSGDFSDETKIFMSNSREDTTYTALNVGGNEIRYYRLTVTDTVGLQTASSIERAIALPTRGLVVYLSFDDDTANDNSGNGHDGKTSGATFSSGIVGDAIEFDGDTDFAWIPHDPVFNLVEKTISFWFLKSNDTIEDTPNRVDTEGLLFKAFDTGLNRAFSFAIQNQLPPFDLVMRVGDGSPILLSIIGAAAIQPRTWYHVACTFDNSHVALYLDATALSSLPFNGTVVHNNAPILIGKVVDSLATRFFNGLIDEIRIYDRVLSENEIQLLSDQGNQGQ